MSREPGGYVVREAVPGDEAEIRELLRSMIGETAVSRWTPEFYRWKHGSGPFGASYAAVACPAGENRAVSVHHAMAWAFLTPAGERIPAARPCDGATEPGHQRRGLYAALDRRTQADLRSRGARLCIGTPNYKTLGMELKTGWTLAARFRSYARPVWRPASLARLMRRTPGSGAGAMPPGLVSWAELVRRFGADRVAEVVTGHEANRRRVGYRTPRDLAYLEWRYAAAPTARYGVWPMAAAGELEGFVIARPASGARGLPALVIPEIFVARPEPGRVRSLLRSLLRSLEVGYVLASFASGTVEHRALRATGFVPLPGKRTVLTTLELASVPLDSGSESSWDLTLGELEIF